MRSIARLFAHGACVLALVSGVARGQTTPGKPVFEASGYGVVRPWFDMGQALALAPRHPDAGGPAEFVTLPWRFTNAHRAELWRVSDLGVPYFAGNVPLKYQGISALWADIDGDGRQDLICCEYGPNGTYVELIHMGASGLQTPGDVVLVSGVSGGTTNYLAAADVNGDGRLDIGVVTSSDNSGIGKLLWLLGGSSGSWTVVLGGRATRFATADLDGDGHAELMNWRFDVDAVSELRDDGTGLFQQQGPDFFGNGDVQLRDLDGDGRLDMVSGKYVHRGGAGGGFTRVDSLGETATKMVDVDHDGRADLIAVEDGHIGVALGSAGLSFGPFADTHVGGARSLSLWNSTPSGLSAVEDVDGDGWTDVLVMGPYAGEVDVVRGHSGGFVQSPTIGTGLDPEQVALADVTGDSHLDLIVMSRGDHRIEVRPGIGDGTFGAPAFSDLPAGPRRFALGDLDHDGRTDLVVVSDLSPTVSVLPGGSSGFGSRTDFTTNAPMTDVGIGDLDEDGVPDVCTARLDGSDGSINGWRGVGSMNFVPTTWSIVASSPQGRFKLGDVDGDGHQDIVYASGRVFPTAFKTTWGDGHGNFGILLRQGFFPEAMGANSPFTLSTLPGTNHPALFYANRDSIGSIYANVNAMAENDPHTASLLPTPPGYFAPDWWSRLGYEVPPSPVQIEVADVTGDCRSDVIVLSDLYGSLTVLPGLDGFYFDTPVIHTVGSNPRSFALGDINGDGMLDAVVADAGSNDVMILRNLLTVTTAVNDTPKPGRLTVRVASAVGASQVRLVAHLVSDWPATLDVFDAQGRKLSSQRLAAPAAGDREVRLDGVGLTRSGLVFVRVSQAGAAAITRAVILS